MFFYSKINVFNIYAVYLYHTHYTGLHWGRGIMQKTANYAEHISILKYCAHILCNYARIMRAVTSTMYDITYFIFKKNKKN